MRPLTMTALLIFSLTSMGCSGLAGADGGTKPKRTPRLHAGGSTFVNLMMQKWIVEYQKAGKAKVNYQSVGSGAGLEYGISKTFDFGGTDMPMTTEQLKKANQIGGEVVHIPLCMGAVVVAYNLPEIEQPVRLSPDVIADIFLGKIKKWNDPKLLKLNPNLTLPDLDIVLVHRSDGSGTTFVMTDYLSKISPEWKSLVGSGTKVTWPWGVGHKGNEGVSEHTSKTVGALGYMELAYQLLYPSLKSALIQNRDGAFIRPTLESVTAAAAGGLQSIPDDLRYSLTNMLGKESYPIAGTVWAVVYTDQRPEKGKALVDFLRWVTHEGQPMCQELHYARMPKELIERVDKKLEQIKTSN